MKRNQKEEEVFTVHEIIQILAEQTTLDAETLRTYFQKKENYDPKKIK